MGIQQGLSFLLVLALGILGFWIDAEPGGRIPAFALILGVILGIAMQRSRFCFYCHLREWLEDGNPRGALALILAIAVGLAGYTVVMSSWLPKPVPGNLPPGMHIGPVSWVLVAAGLTFGAGMVISGSCIGAHWYRLAEGSPTSPFALFGAGIGFILGFNTWNGLYSLTIAEAPIIWLPAHLGYSGALLLQLGVLTLFSAVLWRNYSRQAISNRAPTGELPLVPRTPTLAQVWKRLWNERWDYWTGGLIVGLTGVFAIVRMNPLGMTGTLSSLARGLADQQDWIPIKLYGLDGFAGCGSVPQDTWVTPENLLLLGLVGGAFIASFAGAQFVFRRPGWKEAARGLSGGVLLGWGAMIGLGCSIGTLLSGTQAGAVSGWVFGASMLIAIWSGLKIKSFLARSFTVFQ
jgi:uncharacterized membrane protein YedE/YeeE